jgi:hypothetical protein
MLPADNSGAAGDPGSRVGAVSAGDRLILASDVVDGIAQAQAGGDLTVNGCARPDALGSVIATRRRACSWTVDHAGWVVTLYSPEGHEFYGWTLEEALA